MSVGAPLQGPGMVPVARFPSSLTPDPEHVEVIELEISGTPRPEELGWLSEDEVQRASSFRLERDRARFSRARAGLRVCLGAYLCRDPGAVRLRPGASGKPELADPDHRVRFNLSHSGERALVALAIGREVGVDVELVREGVDHGALARRYFTPAEREAILGHAAGSLQGFFRCWVAKEAYLKARGDGIRAPLDSFEVDVEAAADCLRWTLLPDARRWWIERVSLEGPYVAAVTGERGEWRIRRWRGLAEAILTEKSQADTQT